MFKTNILKSLLAIALLFGAHLYAQKKCMFIGASPDAGGVISENAGYDKHMIPILEEWGYTVDKKHPCGDVLDYTAKDFEPYDFIFLSESIHSSRIGESLRAIYKPMLCAEAMGTRHSKLGFSTLDGKDGGWLYHPGKTAQILSTAGDHKLAAGYAPGSDIDFGTFTPKNSCLMTFGVPTIPVIKIAGMKHNLKQLVAYGVEKGTENSHGDKINHRVSVVGTHAWCYSPKYIGEPVKKLMKAGIEWILEDKTNIQDDITVEPAQFRTSHALTGPIQKISFVLQERTDISLAVWNKLGQKVRTMVNEVKPAGEHTLALDATDMPNGMHFIILEAGEARFTKKILISK